MSSLAGLNCVSPYSDTTSPASPQTTSNSGSFTSDRSRPYTPLDKQTSILKRNADRKRHNSSSQENNSLGSPFHPLQLNQSATASPASKSSSSPNSTPSPKTIMPSSLMKGSFMANTSRYSYSRVDEEGLESLQDRSQTSTPFSDRYSGSSSTSTSQISPSLSISRSSRARTPTVNNTSATRGLSFATNSSTPPDQSSLMNTMNLVSSDSESDVELPAPAPKTQQRRHSSKLRLLPYDLAAKSNNNTEETPNYYHPAYWYQRLGRREVYSRRYRPNAEEKKELEKLEDFLGIPEARKSRKTIIVQQWRLLNPSTSQASNQNIPMSIVLKRGPVAWGPHDDCELVLLTRGFIVARKVFQYIPRFQLGELWTNVEKVMATGMTSFRIVCQDNKTLDFTCPTVSQQQAWMNALRIVVLQAFTHQASLLDIDDDDDANAQFPMGWQYKRVQTPWFTEAVTGQVRLESNMLDQMDNATINTLDSYNQCAPLHYATRAHHVDAMRFLLQAGADPNQVDGMGRTAMQYAEEENLTKPTMELLQSYGGKGPNSDQSCLRTIPVKNTSRRCKLLFMVCVLLLLVATGLTTFMIWFLGRDSSSAANSLSSQESAATEDEESAPSRDASDDLTASSSPPPFLVVGVNPIPATNLTSGFEDSPDPSVLISYTPSAIATTFPGATSAPIDAPTTSPAPDESEFIPDSLAEIASEYGTTDVSTQETTLSPSQEVPEAAKTIAPTSLPSASPSVATSDPSTDAPTSAPSALPTMRTTSSPTYPSMEFLPLATTSPTFAATEKATSIAPTVAPSSPTDYSSYFLPQITESPTFFVATIKTTVAPTAAISSTPSVAQTATEAPSVTPTGLRTAAPTAVSSAETASPTASPAAALTPSPTVSPVAAVSEAASTSSAGEQSGPTNFPTFASIHGYQMQGSDLLPEDMLLFEFLVEKSLDNGASLHNPKSPQFKAFRWLSGNTELTYYSDERKIQRYALATLYYSTEGEEWSNNQYWLSDEDECTMWFSRIAEVVSNAVCNTQNQIVTLDLDYNNLRGTLPLEVGLLTHLRRMELYGGAQYFLTGTIPTEIGLLQELESFSVKGNRMTGALPSELGRLSALSNLNLSQNRFSGTIPSQIGMLQHLESINMETNRLTGPVPSQLGQVGGLQSISLGTNSLTGEIFTEIGLLTELRGLDLEINQLSSTIPSEVGRLANLTLLHMTVSGLKGSIPSQVGMMTSLESLQLRGNALKESIPTAIGKLSSLGALDFSFNVLSGQIPSEIGEATLLRSLLLNANRLGGSMPSEMAELSRLNTLRMELNDFTGSVPMDICDVFFNTYPMFYADCFEVACPCCSYCCVDEKGCDCVYAGTNDEFLC